MRGTGADEKLYAGADRFQSFQVGIGLPIFSGAQRSAIAAGRVNLQLAQNRYDQGVQDFQARYRQAVETYRKHLETVRYYERSALGNADTIIATADRQFKGGQINYLDWVLLTNNAVTIRSEYVDAARDLNLSIIDLHSFTNQ
jgi:cobalt-zinc-cadmium resistance protein CzcA